MDDNTFVVNAQGEVIGERNRDRKYPWKERKMKTYRLARLYEFAGWLEYAKRAAACSTNLQYFVMSSPNGDGDMQLQWANFCHLRLCPLCIGRRAKIAAYELSQVLDKVQADHEGTMYLFLTLTVRNCPGDKLGATLGELTKAWHRLVMHRQVKRAIKGWYRALEVTRNTGGGEWHGTYHPHIHAVLAVEPGYFAAESPLYIKQAEWVSRWRLALGADYDPRVHIEAARAKGEYVAGRAAAVEAAKYAVKDEDYIDPRLTDDEAAGIVETYTKALYKRRLVAYGGWLKEAAKALDMADPEDDDLVYIDKETIRADVADLIEEYYWHFGAGDYVLTSRRVNPLKVVASC